MVNYQQGKIYKLINNESSEILYVGSTCDTLPKRLGGHKKTSKRYPNRKVYKNIMEIGGWDNVKIVLIEKYPCDEKIDLLKRERYWIENCNSFNVEIPSRSDEEYRNDNKEKIKQRSRQYRLQNKEKIKEKRSEKITCPRCSSVITKLHLSRHKKSKKCLNTKSR